MRTANSTAFKLNFASDFMLLLWILIFVSVVSCYRTLQVHFKHGEESNSIPHENFHQRKRVSYAIKFQEYLKPLRVPQPPVGGIRFRTEKHRDPEFRSLIPTTAIEQRPLRLQSAHTLPREETAAQILESFLKWASNHGAPASMTPTLNTTRRVTERPPLPWNIMAGSALASGSELSCPPDQIKGQDGVCRPRVMFARN